MYTQFALKMSMAQSAKERKEIVVTMCTLFSISTATAYKTLAKNGWKSGRKKRLDFGKSIVEKETLKSIAAMTKHSIRKNGKQTMPITVARAVLVQNGVDIDVSNSRLRQLLHDNDLKTKNLGKASPSQSMRSLHPNHVHEVDPSVSLLWFAPNGRQRFIRDDEEYKNKSFLEGKDKCLRYVLIDHYSASICVRYYAAKGETAVNMYDFLLYAWGKKSNNAYTFYGLPELLYWDKGSGNINHATRAALEALRVKTDTHMAGNPRAKGAVECANNIVETHFECLLKLEAVHSIEELNDAADRWCAAFNANLVPGFDSRLHRFGAIIGSRQELWQRIQYEQLRELPDKTRCRMIFTTGVQVRKVAGDLTISLFHPKVKQQLRYSVSSIPNIMTGAQVNAQPILVDTKPLILVMYSYNNEIYRMEIEPISFDEAGFPLSATIIGKEYKGKKLTIREKIVDELENIAATVDTIPFASITEGKGFKAHSAIKPENAFITQRKGSVVSIQSVQITELYISYVEAVKKFKARCGIVPDGFLAWLKKEYPQGVSLTNIDDLAHEYARDKKVKMA